MHEATRDGRTIMVNGVVIGVRSIRTLLNGITDPPLVGGPTYDPLVEEEVLLDYMVSTMGQVIAERLMCQAKSGFTQILSFTADVGKHRAMRFAGTQLWFTVGELNPSYEELCHQLRATYRTLAKTQDHLAWLQLPLWRRWWIQLRCLRRTRH